MEVVDYGGKVHVTSSFLMGYGFKKSTISQGMSRFKNQKSLKYQFFTDSISKSRKWIRYDTIPLKCIQRFNLPTENELLQFIGEEVNNERQKKALSMFLKATNSDFLDYQKYYSGIFHDFDSLHKFSKAHALLIACNNLLKLKYKKKELWEIYSKWNFNVLDINSDKTFYRRTAEFETIGHKCLIHAAYGKIKTKKELNDKVLRQIQKYYRDTKQYSSLEIHKRVNSWCLKYGYKEVSYSSIRSIISTPEFMNSNKGFRYGKEWLEMNYEPYRLRLDPDYNGTLWQIDGTKIQVPCRDKNYERSIMWMFVVMDVHSRKIVGYSFGKSENYKVIMSAIENAAMNCNYIPKEILRDNGSAFKHKAINELEHNLMSLGCYIRAHEPEKPRGKAQVERFFGTFQSTQLKYLDGYIGEGIRSTKEGARPSKEILKKYENLKRMRTTEELKAEISKRLYAYNNERLYEDRASPNEKFNAGNLDKSAVKLSESQIALLFWDKATVKVKNSMIVLTEGIRSENKFQYIIYDTELRLRLNLTEVKIAYLKKDRSIIKLYDEYDKWITDLKREMPIPMVREKKADLIITNNDKSRSSGRRKQRINRKHYPNNIYQQEPTFKIVKSHEEEEDNY